MARTYANTPSDECMPTIVKRFHNKLNKQKPWYINGKRITWYCQGYGYKPMGKKEVGRDTCPYCNAKNTMYHDDHWIYCEKCGTRMNWNLTKVRCERGVYIACRGEGTLHCVKSHGLMNKIPFEESEKILKRVERKYLKEEKRSRKIWSNMGRWKHVEV